MSPENKYVKEVIDHFVEVYKLDLSPYSKAYRIWFDTNLHSEIILDFLNKVKLQANTKIVRTTTRNSQFPNRVGYIALPKPPIHYLSSTFKNMRFEICLDHSAYQNFDLFITTLIHELAHLLLYSKYNKYYTSEVATDLFVMAFGLYDHRSMIGTANEKEYITRDQVEFAYRYILLKRKVIKSKGIRKIINTIKLRLIS